MATALDAIRKTLIDGMRQAGQGSYRRRAPNSKALPLLRRARRELTDLVGREPSNAEAWRLLALAHEALLSYGPARVSLNIAIALAPRPDRKDLIRLASLEELEREWKALALTPQELVALGDFLDDRLQESPCDHTLKHSQVWLERHRQEDADRILRELENRGGYCDCEVAMNVVE